MEKEGLKYSISKKKVTFKESEPSPNDETIKELQIRSSSRHIKLVMDNKLSTNRLVSNKTLISRELIRKFSTKIDLFEHKPCEKKTDKFDNNIKDKKSSEKNIHSLLKTITEEVTIKYNNSFDKNFIDSRFNLPEYYEEYVVKNIKVIKNIQFFFQQCDYETSYDKIKSDLSIEFDYSKPYLFFDLDETLIHSEIFDESRQSLYDKIVSFPITTEEGKEEIETFGIFIRPKVEEFLKWVKQHFTLAIFTAAEMNYAEKVLKVVGIFDYFETILDRSSTINVKGFMIKDMSIFNSTYEKLNALIIDNNIYSFSNSLKQGILISSFYEDKNDNELAELRNYIEKFLLEDVSNIISINDGYYMYHELMSNIDEEANIEAD